MSFLPFYWKKPQLATINEVSNILKVNLIYSTLPTKFQKTEMEDIENDMEKIVCLLFHNASNRIAEELLPEERANHEKD